jgi:hypothetical protein
VAGHLLEVNSRLKEQPDLINSKVRYSSSKLERLLETDIHTDALMTPASVLRCPALALSQVCRAVELASGLKASNRRWCGIFLRHMICVNMHVISCACHDGHHACLAAFLWRHLAGGDRGLHRDYPAQEGFRAGAVPAQHAYTPACLHTHKATMLAAARVGRERRRRKERQRNAARREGEHSKQRFALVAACALTACRITSLCPDTDLFKTLACQASNLLARPEYEERRMCAREVKPPP